MGEISDWLQKALLMAERRGKNPHNLRIVVETEEGKTKEIEMLLRRRGYNVIGSVLNFIVVEVKEPGDIDTIARLPEVKYVSYEKKFWPTAYGLDELVKRIAIAIDPLLNKLSPSDLERLGYSFKPASEIPNPFKAMIENIEFINKITSDPIQILKYIKFTYPFGLPVPTRAGWRLVTYTRELMGVPKDNQLKKTFVGVIDTGVRYGPGLGSPSEIECVVYTMLPEPPIDTMSHGSWVHSCAFGRPATTRYGNFYPVSNAPKSVHVKIFTAFGPCSGYQVMKAMEICAQKGCKVVNMSLGGTLTEPIDKDPECQVLDKLTEKYKTIFVVAAGNEDGSFEIGTPGAALKALTVAALDWRKKYKTSSYSSRGWQGKYYKDNKDMFEEHLEKYGDVFLKPDCGGIGGDRDSQIVAACSPWYDGVYDFVPDGWDLMIGTSMATPHVAGLVALAIDRGLLPLDIDKIKEILRKTAKNWIFGGTIMYGKSVEQGWGLFHWNRLKEYREIVSQAIEESISQTTPSEREETEEAEEAEEETTTEEETTEEETTEEETTEETTEEETREETEETTEEETTEETEETERTEGEETTESSEREETSERETEESETTESSEEETESEETESREESRTQYRIDF